jgi:hypothetical protein
MSFRIDPAAAVAAVRTYNAGSYRGRTNIEIDWMAYERFRGGIPSSRDALVEMVRFVGEDFGGAQRRFLLHGYVEEAILIVGNLQPAVNAWRATVETASPLTDALPDEKTLTHLFAPFVGTKRWPVWASKTLHFLRPDVFPILDSRAKKALGMPNLGSSPRDYNRFTALCAEALHVNGDALSAARAVDNGTAPSDIKLLDKILYQLGT